MAFGIRLPTVTHIFKGLLKLLKYPNLLDSPTFLNFCLVTMLFLLELQLQTTVPDV